MTSAPEHGQPRRVSRLRWLLPALAILAFLGLAGTVGPLAGKTAEVQENDNAAYLPASAESTRVQGLISKFAGRETLPAIIVYGRDGGLTEQDLDKINRDVQTIQDRIGGKLDGPPIGPIVSDDKVAARLIVQFTGTDIGRAEADIIWLRELAATPPDPSATDPGWQGHVTGPGGIIADFVAVFGAINGVLLLVTGIVILVILVIVYRSPLLPVVVLAVAGVALGITNGVVYLLAKNDLITLSGQTQGILDVLVLGAGTDYALLLIARFREELRRHQDRYQAIKVAWRTSFEPILASGGTVVLGLLCLYLSDLKSNKALGPVTAIGITCALAAMLILLPAILVLLGRAAFWPFRPVHVAEADGPEAERRGVWGRIAGLVGRRPRVVWVATALVLGAFALGMTRLEADGVPQTEAFLTTVDSKRGQELLGKHFPAGSGSPAVIVAKADTLEAVVAAAKGVDGIDDATPFARGPSGPPVVVDGLVWVDATLGVAPDSSEADQVIEDLRTAVRAVPGAEAKVGGFTASNYDEQQTAQRDRVLIIPIVLGVVFVLLMLLLRSVIAPLLLMVTVVLSFVAALGVSGFLFQDVFGFPGADSSYPLFTFVFLVALGVDYNIFLMSRVREEVAKRGHREGTLTALAVTGGVITSAGVVLAATFAALGVLPLLVLFQIAFTVAFGVLLDTLVVRSLLVPALTVDIGRFVWWPGKLWRSSR